jgi:hypothetical protein
MGTYYSFDGAIEISPPLNYAEIKAVQAAVVAKLHPHQVKAAEKMSSPEDIFQNYMPFTLVIEGEEKETDDGVLTVKRAYWIRPCRTSEGYLGYAMGALMEAIVAAAPGHAWRGQIVAVHEDRMTAKKLVVDLPKVMLQEKDRILREVTGSSFIRWESPDDDEQLVDFL